MLATKTTSCIETSTRWGSPDASAVSAANAVSGPVWAYADGSLHRTGGRSGSPVQYMFPLAAITPRSDPRQRARGPTRPNGVTLTHTASGARSGSSTSAPGKPGVSITTSVVASSDANRASSGPSTTRLVLPALQAMNRCGSAARSGSPSGSSTRTTAAPRSPRMRPAIAAGSPARSTTRVAPRSGLGDRPDIGVRLLWPRTPPMGVSLRRNGMSKYRIVSADAHILEPPDIWKNWLPEKYQQKAPQLAKDAEGGDAWEFAGSAQPDPIGLTATPGMPFDQFRWMGVTYEEARAGCYNGAERAKDMATDGVDAEILFPPQRTVGHFLGDDDDDFVMAGIEAYNNFLFEEFCAPDPTRLVGMAQIPSLGIDAAIDGLRKAKARGAKGVVIGNWPAGGDDISEDDDAFWAAAVDEGMPVTIHILLLSRRARQAQRAAAKKAGGNRLYGGGSAAAKAKAVGGLGSVFSLVPGHISQLVFTGVFDRFPDLQIVL